VTVDVPAGWRAQRLLTISVVPALSRPLATLSRVTALAAVITQGGIAVTGSVVRVTASGLGCPTWPQCFPGSLVPQPHPEVAALHQWIEFGNRLFTGLVGLVGLACLVVALLVRPRRRRLILLAATMPLGVAAQAVLGGITVLTGLAWWTVAVHFLVSMVLVWLAVLLVRASGESDGPRVPVVPRALRSLVVAATAVLAALLSAGTLVTAAGPHAGDARTPRLDLSVVALTQMHADLLVGYLGLLVGPGRERRQVVSVARLEDEAGRIGGIVERPLRVRTIRQREDPVCDLDSDESADPVALVHRSAPTCGTRTSASEAQPGWPICTRLPSGSVISAFR